MYLLKGFSQKIFRLVNFSYKGIHLFLVIVSAILYCVFNYLGKWISSDEYLGILNSIGILSTFFLLAIEKIDYRALRSEYKKEVKFGRKVFSEGQVLVNTIFSILIVEVVLLGIQYLLFIFKYFNVALLILSLLYMISGFIVVVGTWHGRESS